MEVCDGFYDVMDITIQLLNVRSEGELLTNGDRYIEFVGEGRCDYMETMGKIARSLLMNALKNRHFDLAECLLRCRKIEYNQPIIVDDVEVREHALNFYRHTFLPFNLFLSLGSVPLLRCMLENNWPITEVGDFPSWPKTLTRDWS